MQSPDTVIATFHASRVMDPNGFGDDRTYPTQSISDYMDVIQNYILYIQFLNKTNQTILLEQNRKDLGIQLTKGDYSSPRASILKPF